ncbi:3-oxoacyl-ACP reductase FabG [Desulfobulbus rhabdoformis]|uniref:3-oxoacyl-ACP reductase FabG n=1 Tax=Desulfobulbus rhabdoformis TaxID=34032 RepID=UPI001964B4E5|nr:3-oxoacyl-ACP reductase FabG [Desulfobulbus rhabdoformis]MBM9613426.1 3-oxoacyl-ACP reductase FabG [Desulfobulbus rhabdoformis]
MYAFEGKKAVVTGATRGIGRAITEALLAQGALVHGLYGGNQAAADSMQSECSQYQERLSLSKLDVSDYKAVAAFFSELESRWENLDILVNNAGIRRDAILPMMKEEDWRRVIDVNLTGGYNMSKFGLPMMLSQKYGRILFITSPMGHLGFAGQANYSASKAGQVGLMKSLSKEVAKRKITVNCVSPGFIATDFIEDLPEAQVKAYKKMVPANRFGQPSEVADAALFLLSDQAAYINGAVLEITGGL